jgi:RHS repeat-associated protein
MQDPTGLIYLRARWYDPGTGRFLTRDPFPGLAGLPSTQHPYVYAGNNPVLYTDPSGEFFQFLLLAALIGGGFAAFNYGQTQPCATFSSLLNDPGFRQAVLIGAVAGAAAGLVGGGIAVLGAGAFGGGIWGAMLTGAVGGGLAGGTAETAAQLLTYGHIRNPQLVGAAMLSGAATGGAFAAIGYGIGRLARPNRATVYWPSRPHGTSEHWNIIQEEVRQMVGSGEYSEIFVNKSLTMGTGGQVQSPLRPDILAKATTGRYAIVEVVSPSQTYAQLQSRVQIIAKLLGNLFGGGKIIQP